MRLLRLALQALTIASGWGLPSVLHAGNFDLDVGRFATVFQQGQRFAVNGVETTCPLNVCVVPDNQKFFSLASELGVVIAPPILSPSETVGFAGFAVGVHLGMTTISADADYWQAAQSYEFVGNDIRRDELAGSSAPPGTARTIGASVRKGLWLPLPSFELGVGFIHLLDSSLVALHADAKFSLHEGFLNWPLPEIALRLSASRAMGDTAFDLTTAGVDFSLSKQFGILGTVNLTPYAGYQFLWIIADPDVMDATPGVDPVAQKLKNGGDVTGTAVCADPDCNANFVFFDPLPILRSRVFVGARLNFDPISLSAEWIMAFKGNSNDQFVDVFTQELVRLEDQAATQHTVNLKLGADF